MTTRLLVRLTGRVQGVGFRDRILDIAADHEVHGTVRNVRAGEALEIDVEGEAGDIERFLADVLAHPPTFARVASVERTVLEPSGVRGFMRAPTG